ncbi:MAG: cobalt/nickel transport protein [Desulforhopalus sp.]|jgi:cobalt/nickel transport protein
MNVFPKLSYLPFSLIICFFISSPVQAHFGMVIPDQSIITQNNKETQFTLSFSHPFENHTMDLEKPKRFFVAVNSENRDLSSTLEKINVLDHTAWKSSYSFKRPGVYQFVMEPAPYWEPSEDLSIIHYTKTIIPAFGDDIGWDLPVGLPTEIIPLLRPFGNYAGNSFTGQVLVNGAPAPNVDVEVEIYNPEGTYAAPSDYHITQLVKANAEGIFTFTCPLPGWWGFSALTEADYTLKNPEGEDKGVELGAVLWTYFHPITTHTN